MIPANRFLFVILALVLAAGAASAQVPVGTPKFGSFGGGPVDTINLANLNAHFDIPVLHKPGRGLPFNFDLSYDTTFWQPVPTSPGMAWNPVPTAGWSGSALNVGSLGYSQAYSIAFDGSFGIIAYYNFNYYDGFGTPHLWPSSGSACQRNTVDVAWVEWGNYCLLGFLFYNAPFTDTTKDGSGYTLSADACAYMQVLGYPSTCVGVGNLTSTDGNGIVPQNVTPLNPGATPGSVIDRNGNKINVDASGNYTDTLGTLALKAAGGAPNPYTLTYTSPAGTLVSVTLTFASYTLKTNFSCPNVADYGPFSNVSLVDRATLPDGSFYQFNYEPTPGFPGDVTARLASITLPTGGTISYQYTGSNNGIVCADGSTAGLRRTTPDGVWTYDRTVSGAASTTTVTDPQGNQTVIQFQGIYETQRQVYQGPIAPANLLQTVTTCYNGNTTNCPGTAITLPITQRAVTTQLGSNGLQAKQVYSYNLYGLPTQEDDFDYGSSGVGPLLKRTLYTYPNLGTIKAFAQTVTVQDGLGNQVAQTTYNYDETAVVAPPQTPTPQHLDVGTAQRGNLTSVTSWVRGTTPQITLRKTSTYYDTGNLQTATDFNGATTRYNYADLASTCGNSFPTSVSEPLNLSKSMTWNCTGGVQTSGTDENSQPTTTAYTDPYFWRPASTTDPTNAVTNFTYPRVTSGEISLTFNAGASTSDLLQTFDGLGRGMLQQRRQAPGSITFDSVQSYYDSLGRPNGTSLPYSGTAGQQSPGGRAITKTYDALGRILTVTDAGGGQASYAYTQNDVFVTVGPAPPGPPQENTKRRQMEYDGLGRLNSVCEITNGTTGAPAGSCGQTVPQTGYWTKYTYDALGNLTGVTQNAQAVLAQQQTRSYAYDGLSRLTSETNPESGAVSYTYDTDATCGSSSGDRVKRVDALANPSPNTTCYAYDALHRVTSVTYSGPYAASTPNKYFVYDVATINTTPTPTTMVNAKGRLAEAYTATSPTGAKITDTGFSYSARGEGNDVYQSTPQSSGYYHLNETYWANGVPSQLSGNIGVPIINYGVDGEGRTSTVSATPAQNLVTGTLYNLASQPYQVNLGTGDSDAFGYDANTTRMNQYQFNVNNQSVTGTLTWNPNATLQTLAITDPFNNANNQTCTYGYDDLTRLNSANCGLVWSQTFSYDAFGNISKSGSMSFQPTYADLTGYTSNRFTNVPGCTSLSYDANGNLLNDCLHMYAWDAEGRPVTIDGAGLTYDALGRMVEQNRSGAYTQIVYAPTGEKLALMTGQTLQKAFVPLPGKETAVYTSAGLSYYRHRDWLGSSRFASTPSRTMYSDTAYAPFGEPYAQAGTPDLSFTGLNQDTVGGLYDADAREYSIQGRWPSPDPAGISSMHLTDPQTLNRYAYVRNNPLGYVDPSGLDLWDFFGGGGWGGGIWGGGIWDEHLPWDWPIDWQTLIFGPPRIEDFIIKDTWGYSDAELQQFDQYNLERANCVAQSLNTQYPGAGFEPVKDKYGAYGPTKGGHENPDLVANGVPTPLANEISASIKNNSSSQHCGDPTSIWCFGPGTRVGDSLHIPSGEAEPKPDLKNPNISAARVTAHNDRFNPNNDLASALGHVFVDVLWGNIVQFFGGDIDRRCATPY